MSGLNGVSDNREEEKFPVVGSYGVYFIQPSGLKLGNLRTLNN